MSEEWNLRVQDLQQHTTYNVRVAKDCLISYFCQEFIRQCLPTARVANLRFTHENAVIDSNEQQKRLSDYRITNNAVLQLTLQGTIAPEEWILRVQGLEGRTANVRVPKDCKLNVLFQEVIKQCATRLSVSQLRLSYGSRELVNDATKQLSYYGITNNCELVVMQRLQGGASQHFLSSLYWKFQSITNI